MRYPRIRADFVPVIVTERGRDQMFLLGESRRLLVDDPVATDIAGLLDGTHDVGTVAAALDGRHPLGGVVRALRRFEALGVLTEGPAGSPEETAAGWDALGVEPRRATDWPPTCAVHVIDLGGGGTARDSGAAGAVTIAGMLAQLGLPAQEIGADDAKGIEHAVVQTDTPVVVVAGSTLDPRLAALNQMLLSRRGPGWLLVRPRGMVAMLGPHFLPDETGCWECLKQRWSENEQLETFLASAQPAQPRPSAARAELPGTTALLAGLLHTELNVITQLGRSERLTGGMLAFDARDHDTSHHKLVRQPHCQACGDPDLLRKADPAVVITSRAGGTDARALTAAETAGRLGHHVSPYLGVVTRLVSLDAGPGSGDDGHTVTFSYAAGHNLALGRDVAGLRRSLRGQSGGKGRTDAAAKASALGEAIERYCGVWRDDRPTHRATFANLGPGRAIPLRELLCFSAEQYHDRSRRNAADGRFHWIPRPVDDDTELAWTTAWSLTRERAVDLPAAYCWYGHPEARGYADGGIEACAADSNGAAAGTTIEEAVVQGFCEVVERDAVALWWYHRSRLPGVDLSTFPDPWPEAVRRYHADSLGRRLWALDLTADLDIPVFAAVSARADASADTPEDVIVGFGAHLDPGTALVRALAEVNQFLPAVRHRGADGRTRYGIDDPASQHWFSTVRTSEQAWLCPDPDRPPTTAATYDRTVDSSDLAADVAACIRAAHQAGLEVLVVNQSRPDLELAVVKVVVPGARHFWRRLGPGRLWDVPAALGRRPLAADEAGANPYSVFF